LLMVILFLAGCTASLFRDDIPELVYPEKRSSSAITITSDGSTILAVNPDSNTISLIDAVSLALQAEIPVGVDPRTVSTDLRGELAAISNRSSGTVSLVDLIEQQEIAEIEVGALPWGVLISQDGNRVYVACEEMDWIAILDTKREEVISRIPVEDRPNGLALSRDGKTLYVTHSLTARVSIIDLTEENVSAVIPTWQDGNLAQSLILDPPGKKVYLPLTRSNTANTRLSFDTTVFPLVTVVDLENEVMLPKEIISLPEADRPVGLPYDAVFSPDGSKLYVIHAASNDLSVIDMETGLASARLTVGDNPRGVILSPDGIWLFVNNTLSGTVSVIDTRTTTLVNEIPVTDIPLPPVLLEGKKLFHSSRSPDLSRDAWISCNTCHWEGEHDGRTWTFDFAGPRNTTSLLGMINTYPLRWSGEWDESADSEFAITEEQFGTGLLNGAMHPTLGEANAGRSDALDSLASFIDSLAYLPNYHLEERDADIVRRGKMLFDDPVIGCGDCHSGPYLTDYQTHDVGTADGEGEMMGPMIDTPALLGLERSAPYLHDGSADTLWDVLTTANRSDLHGVTSHLTDEELSSIIEYMLSVDVP
jgi:YVTN family beta-propeller protein